MILTIFLAMSLSEFEIDVFYVGAKLSAKIRGSQRRLSRHRQGCQ